MTDAAAPATAPAAPRGLTRQDVFSVLGALGAVISLVTAVLFYFGWRRSFVQAQEMSIDVSLFGFSSQDYVLRSIASLYLPLLVLIGIALGWWWLHGQAVRLLGSDVLADSKRRAAAAQWTRSIALAATAVAVGCLLFALLAGLMQPPTLIVAMANGLADRQWVVPFVLVLATLTAAYASWLYQRLRPSYASVAPPLWRTLLPTVLIAGTVVLGGFWMLEEYATSVGRGYARRLIAGVDQLPRTVVLSPNPLGIEAPNVIEVRVGEAGSPEVHYRTTGLRLLARSGGKVLLVHDDWSPRTGTVIVLADRDELSWQLSR